MRKSIIYFSFLLVATMFVSCKQNEESVGTAILKVRLTDAPGNFEAVHVDIQGVAVKSNNSTGEEGWLTLKNVKPGIYNLLELTNGVDTLLGSDILPAGHMSQIRLILGDKNTVTIDGTTHPLSTPSAQQSGLKIPIDATLADGIAYTILLDFDAGRSVVQTGSTGKYNLKPVIRSIFKYQSGAIKGTVNPSDVSASVYAISGADTVGTYTNLEGNFLLRGLTAGNYKVVLQPSGDYPSKTIDNVSVTLGNVTDVGSVGLNY